MKPLFLGLENCTLYHTLTTSWEAAMGTGYLLSCESKAGS